MNDEELRQIAAQLGHPQGEVGIEVAKRMNVNNELMNRWAIERLRVQPNDRILEIGPGNGHFVPDLLSSQPSATYTGYDHSALMIDQAEVHNRALVHTGQARFVLRAGSIMPFADGVFTKAFAVNVIYFWENPAGELAELHRVLAPSGLLLLIIRPKSVMLRLPFVKHGFRLFEPTDVADMLEANRFRVIDTVELPEPPQQVNGAALPLSTVLLTGERQK